MREQADALRPILGHAMATNWSLAYVDFMTGVTSAIGMLELESKAKPQFRPCQQTIACTLLFNAGIHDAYMSMYGRLHFPGQYKSLPRFSLDDYAFRMASAREHLNGLFPTSLLIFRTVTAAWLRFGNLAFDFNKVDMKQTSTRFSAGVSRSHRQRFGEGRHVCHAMNDRSIPSFLSGRRYSIWGLIDGYGPTVGRPDDLRDATHPQADSFGPINAQLMEATFLRACPKTLERLRLRDQSRP